MCTVFYFKIIAVPGLLCKCKMWVSTKIQIQIHGSEMNVLRWAKGCRRQDRIQNDDIRKEIQICSLNGDIQEIE